MSNTATTFPVAPPRFFDDGLGARLLQTANQAPLVAPSAAYVQAEAVAVVAALVAAGIMRSV